MITLIALLGCKKDAFDLFSNKTGYYPEVKTISVKLLGGDTVEIKGHIIYAGQSSVEFAGFCFCQNPIPTMTENQILLGPDNGDFIAFVTGLKTDSTYYFRSFASNKYGYAYGDIIKFTMPHIGPPDIPCTLVNNVIVNNGTNNPIYVVYQGTNYSMFGGYGVQAECSGFTPPVVTLEFHHKPTNGIYFSSSSDNFNYSNFYVYAYVRFSSDNYPINGGDKIYVVENPNGSYTVTFCNLTYQFYSTTINIKGKILVN